MSNGLIHYCDRPVFVGIMVDASGSMAHCADDAAACQKAVLDTLRESEKCDRGVLYVSQFLVTTESPKVLHGFYPLDRNGNDHVVALTPSNYRPGGPTALYGAILDMVSQLTIQIQQVRKEGFVSSARLIAIVGGEDNASRVCPEEVRTAIELLREHELLGATLLLGLTDRHFDETRCKSLCTRIGFRQEVSIPVPFSPDSRRLLRRAFALHAVQRAYGEPTAATVELVACEHEGRQRR